MSVVPPDEPEPSIMRSLLILFSCLVLCFAAAGLGSALTVPNIGGWYEGLAKPAFNPPNWIFGPVWTLLFAMMAVALWRVLTIGRGAPRRQASIAFAMQLALNVAWSAAFFAGQSPALALVVIVALLVAILGTIDRFGRIDRLAGWLLVPYLLWVTFASILNLSIWILN